MERENSPRSIVRHAREMLKDFWRPIYGAQLLAIVLFIGVITVVIFLAVIVISAIPRAGDVILPLAIILAFVPGIIIYSAMLGSVFGIIREIMIGGDYYVEFKNAFFYFKKYWKQYALSSIMLSSFTILFSLAIALLRSTLPVWFLFACLVGVNLAWYSAICFLFPAASAGFSFRSAVRTSLSLFRGHAGHVLKSYGPYFLIQQIMTALSLLAANDAIGNFAMAISFLAGGFVLEILFVPFLCAISSLLYYSLQESGTGERM
jgi:hypothetical protein